MYPACIDDLAPTAKLGLVDIVLTDIHYWVEPRGVKGLAAMLQTASSIPEMTFTGDAHYHYLTDDIIVVGV